jgi:hypothetical protein
MKKVLFQIVGVDASNAHCIGTIARSFYGEDYPVEYVYQPDVICKDIEAGRLISRLAIDSNGQAAGYTLMSKTAPNPRIWELESLAIAPEYAQTDIFFHMAYYCVDLLKFQLADADGFYAELVCCNRFTQFAAAKRGMLSCAIQLDQLDGESFKDRKSNQTGAMRVSSILSFWEKTKPSEEREYVPEPYNKIIKYITSQLYPRTILPSTGMLPTDGITDLAEKYYPPAQIMTVDIASIGGDWVSIVEDILNRAKKHRIISLHVTLNMACPWIGAAISVMREKGFFFGGVAPRWFGTDGLFMQKLFGSETEYDKIKLRTKTAQKILAFIVSDREAVCRNENV